MAIRFNSRRGDFQNSTLAEITLRETCSCDSNANSDEAIKFENLLIQDRPRIAFGFSVAWFQPFELANLSSHTRHALTWLSWYAAHRGCESRHGAAAIVSDELRLTTETSLGFRTTRYYPSGDLYAVKTLTKISGMIQRRWSPWPRLNKLSFESEIFGNCTDRFGF
jgi:hypothetical protein